MKEEKRILKGYKTKDSTYKKAMKRAQKSKTPLATLIESFVWYYANNYEIKAVHLEESEPLGGPFILAGKP